MTVGIALACALSASAAATAATIHVNETVESATFVHGNATPADYYDSIAKLSNHNGKCSLREAIEASNKDTSFDGCAAGSGPGDVVELPAGEYDLYDNLIVLDRVVIRGANAGLPGNDPGRGPETTIKLVNNPNAIGNPALFWLGAGTPSGPALGGGSEFDGLTLTGNSNPLCVKAGLSGASCEEWAIVQPEKSGGASNTAPGFKLRNSIVRDFTAGVYLGGKGAEIVHNLFKDNKTLMDRAPGASGVDVYSDGVYTNLTPHVVGNVFPNPRIAAVELQGVPDLGEKVSGGLIRDNLIDLQNGEPYFAILLLNTQGQRIQDNVIGDPTPPPVETLCCTDGIELDAVRDVVINGNTITGLAAALRVSEAYYPVSLPGVSDVHVTHNRFYANLHGIRVFTPYPPSSLDARANWWGANGGAGSNGARPGAANPVNGLWFGHIDWAAGGAIVEDPPPNPNWIDASAPLQLTCSLAANVTVNTPVPLTGRLPGMPSVDRSASTSPWFETVHTPLMAAGVSGVPGSTYGFGQVPSTGISAGQVIAGGGSLTGVLVATAAGAGAGQVALDSEQVGCPFQAAKAVIEVDKTTPTSVAAPGELVTYRISVRNRGRAPVRGLRACDEAPRALRFVRSTRRVRRAAGGRLCLMIRTLQPGQRQTFSATFQVSADATAQTVVNEASADMPTEASPLPPAGPIPPKTRRRPVDRDTAPIRVRTGPPRVTG